MSPPVSVWNRPKPQPAAITARATIIGFIRTELPATSPDAYTAAELATLNRHRSSRQPFAPYAADPDD